MCVCVCVCVALLNKRASYYTSAPSQQFFPVFCLCFPSTAAHSQLFPRFPIRFCDMQTGRRAPKGMLCKCKCKSSYSLSLSLSLARSLPCPLSLSSLDTCKAAHNTHTHTHMCLTFSQLSCTAFTQLTFSVVCSSAGSMEALLNLNKLNLFAVSIRTSILSEWNIYIS